MKEKQLLFPPWQEIWDAKQKLIEIYLPQVVDLPSFMPDRAHCLRILIGEGNVALTMAVEMLETASNAAGSPGNAGKHDYGSHGKLYHRKRPGKETGNKMAEKVNQVADQAKELAESLGRKVTIQELADESRGMTLYEIKEAVQFFRRQHRRH